MPEEPQIFLLHHLGELAAGGQWVLGLGILRASTSGREMTMTVEGQGCHGNAPSPGCCNLGSGLAPPGCALPWVLPYHLFREAMDRDRCLSSPLVFCCIFFCPL